MFRRAHTQRVKCNLRLLCFGGLASLVIATLAFTVTQIAGARFDDRPLPQAQTDFIRQIPLTANDVVYSPLTKLLYASVPSSVGSGGNSITTIDPTSGAITSSVFIGSEPNKLALSDDGNTLYASLEGAFSIRRFDVSSQIPGLQFPVGRDSFFGVYQVADLAVAPGNPNLVAVARSYPGTSPPEAGVAVFDNGVPRSNAGPGHISGSDYLAFSASAAKLYGSGFYSGLTTLKIDANGVSITGSSSLASGSRVKFDNGVIYAGNGQEIDPDTSNGTLKGTFSGITNSGGPIAFVPDSSVGRAYYLVSDQFSGSTRTLKVFDINTFLQLGTLTISGVVGDVTNIIRWGSNGLAFRTTGKQLFIIQTSLIPSGDPIPTPTPTPSATPTATPSPQYIPSFVRRIDLQANDLVYNQSNQRIYASVPSSQGSNGNSITTINPPTGAVGSSIFVGSEPDKLALSDDGQSLYVNLDGAAAIRRFDVPTQTPGLQFPHGVSQQPADLKVMPGNPQTVAVSLGINNLNNGVAIFDNGVKRSSTGGGNYYAVGPIEFNGSSTIYGYDSFSSGFELVKFSVSASGVTPVSITNNLLQGYVNGLKFSNGLLYSVTGRVVDPEAQKAVGTFQLTGFNTALAVDGNLGKVFFVSNPGSSIVLSAYDINTFLPLGAVTLPTNSGTPTSLVRWGSNGLAFRVTSSGSSNPSAVYLVQSALVSSSAPVPTGIQLGASAYNAFEGIGSVTIAVTRTGDVSAPTSVDYATSDGTATAGSDYTATSGTLTFAAGELSKTISIPIIDDNLYEGTAETFNLTISNPTGGAILSSPSVATITINDNDSKPTVFMANTGRVTEGNSGTKTFSFPVNLSNPSVQTLTVDYTTADGTATAGSDYVATSGTLTFPPGTTTTSINVTINGDSVLEPDETFFIRLSNATNASFISVSQATITIANDDSSVQLSSASYSGSEASISINVTVTRLGDLSSPATVDFATSDNAGANNCNIANGNASSRCDYISTLGTVSFVPGQSFKTIPILVIDDSYAEGNESFSITLSNPSGSPLGAPASGTVTITDNDSVNGANPIDAAGFFVREHYYDFLNRQPDASGLAFWTNEITSCGTDQSCITSKRINVSAAYFLSTEFQQTGYLVERLYKAAYGDGSGISTFGAGHQLAVPIVRFNEFLPDTQQIGQGVVVGQTGWETVLENNKQAFSSQFVQRPRFTTAFPTSMTPAQFVDRLNTNAGNVLSANDRATAIALFGGALDTNNLTARAQALRQVAENQNFYNAEFNRAFVLMQYFGYLRRNPNEPQDSDYTGYDFWLAKLNQFNGNFVAAEMVKAFITSAEYRQRFGP
ncbi:MAG: hypothetical protein DMF74_09040 [Acidobacteria bacterium]|nr:MAG: hypothetical protein DMF74_09040 [Acidobacteriota bacterium]